MTEPLPITDVCGCPIGEGHFCRPPWVDEAEWERARREDSRDDNRYPAG